ncbi:MAG: hypothetical protein NVSMB52_16750 [Chloroflexota bacterium]
MGVWVDWGRAVGVKVGDNVGSSVAGGRGVTVSVDVAMPSAFAGSDGPIDDAHAIANRMTELKARKRVRLGRDA